MRLRPQHEKMGAMPAPWSPSRPDLASPAPTPAAAVARFLLGSVFVLLLVLAAAFFATRSVALDEARRDTAERVQALARLVEVAGLENGIVRGDPAAIDRLDRIVVGRVIGGSLVRVKIWGADGTILYSDARTLIGERYDLGADEQEAIAKGATDVDVSDLSEPENRLEGDEGRLMEAYTRIRAPDGTPMLFEIYERFSSVTDDGYALLERLAPGLIGALALLIVLQVPLAWSLAQRVRRGAEERASLMAYAVDASNLERERIAADLHDGVVQDLAGMAFGLAPAAAAADRDGRAEEAKILRETASGLQQSVRDLRTLLVEIHPRNLEMVGIDAALRDLLSPLTARGIVTELSVEGALTAEAAELLYRVGLEAVRNAADHAEAQRVSVEVDVPPGAGGRIVIRDNGRGFDPARRIAAQRDGHVGLTLIATLVERAGGTLEVQAAPAVGTIVTAEVPIR
jgi:two-component system, NarL family, sensor kinase